MIPVLRHETVGPSPASHRLRIAHLSDLHLWFGERKLRRIEALIAAAKPDVLALTGDYADTATGRRRAVDWIRRMAHAYPLCWVAGNHDRWDDGRFMEALEAVPHAHPIDRRDAWIASPGGARYRFTSLERMSDRPPGMATAAPTVVLLHDPAHIEPEKLHGAQNRLLLAGHLHGGQITLWRDRQGRPQPAAACYRWLVERTTIDTVPLIVSRGLGDTLPFRFRVPREIVLVDFGV